MRTVLNPLGFVLAGLAIGYVLARPLSRLTRQDGRNGMAVDFPPGSERETMAAARLRTRGHGPNGPLATPPDES